MKNVILKGSKPYDSREVEKFLKDIFGESLLSSIQKKLVITSILSDRSPPELCLFKSFKGVEHFLPPSESNIQLAADVEQGLMQHNKDAKVWEACRASSAAPYYFEPFLAYVDGGLIANNPTLDTMTEYFSYMRALEVAERTQKPASSKVNKEIDFLVSMGTGRWPVQSAAVPDTTEEMNPLRNIAKLKGLNRFLADVTTQTDAHMVERAQAWCYSIETPFFRFNPPLSSQVPLDAYKDDQVIGVLWETKLYVRTLDAEFRKMAKFMDGVMSEPIRRPNDHV